MTSFGSTIRKLPAGKLPADPPNRMLPWNFSCAPVPVSSVPPLPVTMLSATVMSVGSNFLSLPNRAAPARLLWNVLNATTQWSAASCAVVLFVSSLISPPPISSACPVVPCTTLLMITWLLPKNRMPLVPPMM